MNNDDKYISVGNLTDLIKANLENTFPYLYIKGEVSNFRPSSSGIWYLSLKDKDASIKGIVFKNSQPGIIASLRQGGVKQLENGQEILVEGKMNVYKQGGDYSILINKITPIGTGGLFEEFERLKAELNKKGLFDATLKKELPKFPEHIGIVTSPTSAALQDILNVLARRHSSVRITVFPAAVQGEKAKNEIISAIKCADYHYVNHTDKSPDVLILARGGGSIEDLWPFNEEEVAYAIYESDIPIITGVGHEIDYTISDFCADMRAPTPSAAAEIAVSNRDDLLNQITAYKLRIESSFYNQIERFRSRFLNSSRERMKRVIEGKHREKTQTLSMLSDKLKYQFDKIIEQKRQQASLLVQKLDDISPLKILSRGYSVTYTENGKTLRSVESVNAGDTLKITVSDGDIEAKVTSYQKKTYKC